MAARAQRALPMRPLAQTLHLLADVARIRGRQRDAAALDRVAARLSSSPADSAPDDDRSLVRDALDAIRDLGPEAAIAAALEDTPQDIRRLVADHTLTAAEAARLVAESNAVTAGDLLDVFRHDGAAWLPTERREALARVLGESRLRRSQIPLGRAWSMIDALTSTLQAIPDVEQVAPTGRTRRYDSYVGAVGVLLCTSDPPGTAARLIGLTPDLVALHAGPRTVVFRLERTDVTIRLVTPDTWAHALVWFTGSSAHLDRLAACAAERGLTFGRDGLRDGGRLVPAVTEADVYAALGLPAIPPEMRESGEEVQAAIDGTLPEPVRVDQIRGDLHMHSDWSDGRNTMEAMVSAAEALGYAYVAITDHSVSSGIARGLDVDRLARQREAVLALRETHAGIVVLHGAEVDILHDGTLDFADDVLESLDVVLASLHDPAGQDGATLTARYVTAMRHPLVQIVTHPTNRLVPGRPGYALDEPRLFEAALETGTLLEIDGAPGHLDMDGAMARRAMAAGVEVSVDGDCHRADWLGRQMQFGVATARRGWVPADRVVNTRTIDALRTRLHRKRLN